MLCSFNQKKKVMLYSLQTLKWCDYHCYIILVVKFEPLLFTTANSSGCQPWCNLIGPNLGLRFSRNWHSNFLGTKCLELWSIWGSPSESWILWLWMLVMIFDILFIVIFCFHLIIHLCRVDPFFTSRIHPLYWICFGILLGHQSTCLDHLLSFRIVQFEVEQCKLLYHHIDVSRGILTLVS